MSAWTPPLGMTLEPLHGDDEQPVCVAIVMLAPGTTMVEPETHVDMTERIRLISGDLCVAMMQPRRDAPGEFAEVPYDLGSLSRCYEIVIPAGTPHRLIAWNRSAPAVYVGTMTRPHAEQMPPGVIDALTAFARDIKNGDESAATSDALRQAMGWLDDADASALNGDPRGAIPELDSAIARILHARARFVEMVEP